MSNFPIIPQQLRLPQPLAFQCDVLIWRSAAGLGAIGHPGHASVLVRREVNEGHWSYIPDEDEHPARVTPRLRPTRYRYMSFWPDEGKKSHKGKVALFSKGSALFRTDHLDDCWQEINPRAEEALGAGSAARAGQYVLGNRDKGDGPVNIWGQWPQAIISLPGLNSTRMGLLGLDLRRMVNWAIRFKNSDEFDYVFVSKSRNCAGIAVRALAAGGGEAFAPLGGSHAKATIYMNPNDVESWVNAVRLGVQNCNRMLGDLRNLTVNLPRPPRGLLTVDEWKSISKVAFTIRGRLTSAVDKALRTYHATTWDANFAEKLKALVTVIHNTHEHLQMQGDARNDAYLRLAQQLLVIVAQVSRSADDPWETRSYYGSGGG